MKFILYTTFYLALFGGFCYAGYKALTIPEVFMSYSSKQCIKIVTYEGRVEKCSLLKKYNKYHLVWVE